MESLKLNCKPLIVSCNWPPELCISEESSAVGNGYREAASEILRRELERVERSFLGLSGEITDELRGDVILKGNYASERYAKEINQ